MKIISKYKDYYDYLSGVLGVDPLLVLDRRESENYECITSEKIIFYICGYRIEGYFDGEKYYYGKKLKTLGVYHRSSRWNSEHVHIVDKDIRICLTPEKYVGVNPNIKFDCPILMQGYSSDSFRKFPRLSNFSFGQAISSTEIYQMLVNWLSAKKTLLENKPDKRTDEEKIVSDGFDLVTSFRH